MSDEPELTGKAKSLQNLRPPWQPGETGNPAGKPPGSLNRETIYRKFFEMKAIKKFADEHAAEVGEEAAMAALTIGEQVAVKDFILALKGNEGAMERVFDNINGKLAAKTELTVKDGLSPVLDAIAGNAPDPLPSKK